MSEKKKPTNGESGTAGAKAESADAVMGQSSETPVETGVDGSVVSVGVGAAGGDLLAAEVVDGAVGNDSLLPGKGKSVSDKGGTADSKAKKSSKKAVKKSSKAKKAVKTMKKTTTAGKNTEKKTARKAAGKGGEKKTVKKTVKKTARKSAKKKAKWVRMPISAAKVRNLAYDHESLEDANRAAIASGGPRSAELDLVAAVVKWPSLADAWERGRRAARIVQAAGHGGSDAELASIAGIGVGEFGKTLEKDGLLRSRVVEARIACQVDVLEAMHRSAIDGKKSGLEAMAKKIEEIVTGGGGQLVDFHRMSKTQAYDANGVTRKTGAEWQKKYTAGHPHEFPVNPDGSLSLPKVIQWRLERLERQWARKSTGGVSKSDGALWKAKMLKLQYEEKIGLTVPMTVLVASNSSLVHAFVRGLESLRLSFPAVAAGLDEAKISDLLAGKIDQIRRTISRMLGRGYELDATIQLMMGEFFKKLYTHLNYHGGEALPVDEPKTNPISKGKNNE